MSEVIKLHQDEGVINLLHALPASRRRPSSSYVATSQSPNTSNSNRRRPSNEVERGQSAKGLSQASAASETGLKSSLNAVWQRRHINPANLLRNVIDPQSVRPCTQEELMKSASLDILKQLPDKEYAKLWSSPARYNLVPDHRPPSASLTEEATSTGIDTHEPAVSQASPSGSVTSIESSVSKSQAITTNNPLPDLKLRHGRTKPWRIQTKHFKDILLRTYGTFVQIILSPSSTGLKNSVNANVCDELNDILKQLESDNECRSIMITGKNGLRNWNTSNF